MNRRKVVVTLLSSFFIVFWCIKSSASGHEGSLFIYAGANLGFYNYHQAPLDYRAWEFNNNYSPSKKMNSKYVFSGLSYGTMINFSGVNNRKIGILGGLELDFKNTRMHGVGTSANGDVEQRFDEKVRTFYFGLGLSTPNRKAKTGELAKFTIGYIPFVGLCKLRLLDDKMENGNTTSNGVYYKGSTITLKHTLVCTYRVSPMFKICAYPFFENHLIGPLEAIYSDANTSAYEREYFNLKNCGINLCLGYCF